MTELTVDKVEELIEWLELPLNAQHPTQQHDGVFSSPLEIYKFLLTELANKERDIDMVCAFVAAYEKRKFEIMRDGGKLLSVNVFMVEYCEKLRTA